MSNCKPIRIPADKAEKVADHLFRMSGEAKALGAIIRHGCKRGQRPVMTPTLTRANAKLIRELLKEGDE